MIGPLPPNQVERRSLARLQWCLFLTIWFAYGAAINSGNLVAFGLQQAGVGGLRCRFVFPWCCFCKLCSGVILRKQECAHLSPRANPVGHSLVLTSAFSTQALHWERGRLACSERAAR